LTASREEYVMELWKNLLMLFTAVSVNVIQPYEML